MKKKYLTPTSLEKKIQTHQMMALSLGDEATDGNAVSTGDTEGDNLTKGYVWDDVDW